MGNSNNNNSNFARRKSAEQYTKPIPPKDIKERLSSRRVVRNKYGVSIIHSTATEPSCRGEVIDVNEAFSGMGLLSDVKLTPNTPIQIVFSLGGKEVKISAVVVWCNRLPTNNHVIKINNLPHSWRVGISVLENAENKAELEHIKELI